MSDSADASASFELQDDSLSAGLDAIAAKFEAIANQINASFAGANAQLNGTAAAAQSVGAQASLVSRLGAGLAVAAAAAQTVSTALGGIVMAATRIAPFVKYIPDSLGRWVPPVKQAAEGFVRLSAQVGVVTKGAQTLTGRLSVLSAGFLALELRELGASKGMAVFGAAGALATSKIISGSRAALGAITSLASGVGSAAQRAMGGVGGMFSGLGRSLGTAATFAAPMAGLALTLGPVGAAAIGTTAAFAGLGKAIASAGEIQSFTTSMATLLGGTDKARERMAELSRFAADTPFELPGVVKASKLLQTLTNGALATGDGLRLVGDLAAISGQPFEELAMHVGRLYQGLMDGRPVGESMQRLQELGLVSGATRTKLENLQQAGSKGGGVWRVAAADLMRYSGEMQRQSMTWGGVMSNFADGVGRIFSAIGAPLITALTPFMLRVNAWLATVIPWAERFGSIVAGWGAVLTQIFADGKAPEALGLALKLAFGKSVNLLVAGMVAAGEALLTLLSSGSAWKGLGSALMAVMQGVAVALFDLLSRALDKLRNVPLIGNKAGAAATALKNSAADMADRSMTNGQQAAAGLKAGLADAAKEFRAKFSSFGDVVDTSGFADKLNTLMKQAGVAAQVAIDSTAKLAESGNLPTVSPSGVEDPGKAKKGGTDVASLQKIAGGGGFALSGRDALLSTASAHLNETKNSNKTLDKILTAIEAQRIGSGVAVFA